MEKSQPRSHRGLSYLTGRETTSGKKSSPSAERALTQLAMRVGIKVDEKPNFEAGQFETRYPQSDFLPLNLIGLTLSPCRGESAVDACRIIQLVLLLPSFVRV